MRILMNFIKTRGMRTQIKLGAWKEVAAAALRPQSRRFCVASVALGVRQGTFGWQAWVALSDSSGVPSIFSHAKLSHNPFTRGNVTHTTMSLTTMSHATLSHTTLSNNLKHNSFINNFVRHKPFTHTWSTCINTHFLSHHVLYRCLPLFPCTSPSTQFLVATRTLLTARKKWT